MTFLRSEGACDPARAGSRRSRRRGLKVLSANHQGSQRRAAPDAISHHQIQRSKPQIDLGDGGGGYRL